MNIYTTVLAITMTIGVFSASANASVILTPLTVTTSSNSGITPDENIINQSGLSSGYTSGVTDFDVYIASNPLHGNSAKYHEWWSANNITSAVLDFDLGSLQSIDRLALWHEEGAGFTAADIYTSIDGLTFTLAVTINPLDNVSPGGLYMYPVEVFDLAGGNAVSAQYVRMNLSGCAQQPFSGTLNACAVGEMAFSAGGSQSGGDDEGDESGEPSLPEPATLGFLGLGLAGLAFRSRKRA